MQLAWLNSILRVIRALRSEACFALTMFNDSSQAGSCTGVSLQFIIYFCGSRQAFKRWINTEYIYIYNMSRDM